jgi:Protein of unknown function (DUF2568)
MLAARAPLLAAAAWALFGAPARPASCRGLRHLGLEVLILGGAALALYTTNRALALGFAAMVLVIEILLYALGQA